MGPRNLLIALLSLATPPLVAASGPSAHEPPARVEVLEGRAVVALPSSVLRLEGGAPLQQFVGPLHLEVAPASRARVGWSGLGSLLLEGRAVVEWRASPQPGGLMRWTVVAVDRASLEVRRGRVHLELPGGWRGLLQPGAYSLRGLPGGPVELQHDAGLPLTLWPPAGETRAQPPYTVLAGSSVRLLAEAPRPITLPGSTNAVQAPHAQLGFEARATASASFPAWSGFSWPWGRPEEASAPRAVPLPGRGPLGEPLPQPAPAKATSPPTDPQEAPAGAVATPESPAPQQQSSPLGESGDPRAPSWSFLPVRRAGELVMTPYGPRWADVIRVLSQLRQPTAPNDGP